MKKMSRRMLSMVLAFALTVGCMTGCGGSGQKTGGKSATDIEISYLNQGLGVEWIEALIKAFKEKYPEYNVYYTASASGSSAKATLGLKDTDTIDLYMGGQMYDMSCLEPLNEVLDTTIDGETKSIKEKFNASYLATEEIDGNYYTLTYGGGIIGFVYSKKLFEEAGITELPRTTNELAMVCTKLSDKDITPLCHFYSGDYGYYEFMQNVWFAQYDGVEYFSDFLKDATKDKMMKKDGRYEALKVLEKIVTPNYTLQGSNSESHVSMQTKFLEGSCAMMLNGSWLSSEMSNSDKMNDFEMMKTPVISSITDKLETVKSETQLRALIQAIDEVTDGTKSEETYKDGDNYKVEGNSVSAADWNYVRVARNMMATTYSGTSAFIPNYSNAKDGAKQFLKFMYSDEGYQIYMNAQHLKLPLELCEGKVDTSSWNAFQQNQAELFTMTEYTLTDYVKNKDRILVDGGAHQFARGAYSFVNLMSTKNEADRVGADEAWAQIESIINDRYDSMWMQNIK